MGKSGLNRSLIYNDHRHREFKVPVFLRKRVTEMPLFSVPYNAGFPFSLYLRHQHNRLENISVYYFPLFNSVAKNLSLGKKKKIGGACAPLAVCVVLLVTQVIAREAPTMFPPHCFLMFNMTSHFLPHNQYLNSWEDNLVFENWILYLGKRKESRKYTFHGKKICFI